VARYPYLTLSLALVSVAGLCMLAFRRHRRGMLLSGLMCAPTGLLSFAFVPEYWRPVRVAEFVAGPEDILYSFANGVIIWAAVAATQPSPLLLRPNRGAFAKRYWALSGIGAAVFYPLGATNLPVMTAALLTMAALGAAALWRRPGLWRLSVAGAAIFGLWYALLLRSAFAVWPHFAGQWSHENLWGLQLAGMPLEEIAWGAMYGAVWPTIIAYVLGASLPARASGAPARTREAMATVRASRRP